MWLKIAKQDLQYLPVGAVKIYENFYNLQCAAVKHHWFY